MKTETQNEAMVWKEAHGRIKILDLIQTAILKVKAQPHVRFGEALWFVIPDSIRHNETDGDNDFFFEKDYGIVIDKFRQLMLKYLNT